MFVLQTIWNECVQISSATATTEKYYVCHWLHSSLTLMESKQKHYKSHYKHALTASKDIREHTKGPARESHRDQSDQCDRCNKC